MKRTDDFLSGELKDDEMIVINGGLASPLQHLKIRPALSAKCFPYAWDLVAKK